jgi:hypothetical protein
MYRQLLGNAVTEAGGCGRVREYMTQHINPKEGIEVQLSASLIYKGDSANS